ncbi:MAG: TrbI/VirB10 family protein [Bdellovibrionales bacterium]
MTSDFENDPNEDAFEPEATAANGSEQKKTSSGNLAAAWRTSPFFRFTVLIVAVFAIGAAAINFFGGESKTGAENTRLSRPPTLNEAPGGVASPYMRQQTELANTERAQQAIASGGSAIPTPLGQPTDVSGFGNGSKKDDPLKELRAETERLKKQVQQQQQAQQQQQVQQQQLQPEKFDTSLSQAMQRQMQQLLASWAPQSMKVLPVVGPVKEEMQEHAEKQAAADAAATHRAVQKIVVNAGTVSYAQLLTEANSDVPGPILAQIVSGPLAGARAVGSFQTLNGYEKYLVLKFTLAGKKGKDYALNAIALDPDTTLGGMATEVDERYFARVVLPAAASFLEGLGDALADTESQVVTSSTSTITTQAEKGLDEGLYEGLGKASRTAGQFFQQQANMTKPLVRVAAGTPFGLFFVASVKEPTGYGEIDQLNQGQTPGVTKFPQTTTVGTPGAGTGDPAQGMYTLPYPNYAAPSYNSGYGYGTYRPETSYTR